MRKADAAWYCPIEHRGHHCSRLAEKGDISRLCREMRRRRVEPQARHHDPDAARPDYARQIGFCRFQHGLPQCTTKLTSPAEAGGIDYARARAPLAKFADQRRYGLGRGGDDGQIQGSRQVCDVRIDGHAIDSVGIRIDQRQFAGKAGAAEVARDHRADRASPSSCPDQGYRSRIEHFVEVANRHWLPRIASVQAHSDSSPTAAPPVVQAKSREPCPPWAPAFPDVTSFFGPAESGV